jgi:UDP-N-acetylglucosamine pyrophosphorylase
MKDIEIVVFNDKSWVRLTEYQKVKEESEKLKKENEQLTMRILKMRMIFNSTYGAGGNISKKKPILEVGTKIKFSDGDIATIVYLKKEIILFFESHKEKLDYLIGRTWEIVE